MKGVAFFAGAMLLGALAYWGVEKLRDEQAAGIPPGSRNDEVGSLKPAVAAQAEGASGVASAAYREVEGASLPETEAPDQPLAAKGTEAAPPGAAAILQRPKFYQGNAQPGGQPGAEPPPAAAGVAEVQSPPATPTPGTGAPASSAAAPGTTAPRPPASALEEDRKLAREAFDAGDRARGAKLLEEVFTVWRERPGVDLSEEARRLLLVEGPIARKREYLQYLVRLDSTGRVFEEQLKEGVRKVAGAESSADTALAAWDDLSLAYEIARDRSQRKKVLAHLEPFIEKMVFAGRYSPLLKSYTIKSGDKLSSIAAQSQTTADALRRLNNLKSDIIQPRQRLRILAGKVKLFVDKSEFILWMTVDDRVLMELPVGLGRDNATPLGRFTIRVRQKDPTWWRPGEPPIPAGDPRNVLGTRWLGFQETQELAGFGIHGTDDPASLGKESSAGCIRLRREHVELLFDLVPYGTEVLVAE